MWFMCKSMSLGIKIRFETIIIHKNRYTDEKSSVKVYI